MNKYVRKGPYGDILGTGDESSDDSEEQAENVEIQPKEQGRGVKPKDTRAKPVEDEDDPENFAISESSGESSSGEEFFMDQEELSESDAENFKETETIGKQRPNYICEKCGLEVSKPALLAQHMLSHSNQRSFACPQSGCSCSYKRQDHLNRHLKKHEGVLFFCSHSGCQQSFSVRANLQRHIKSHEEKVHFPRAKSSERKMHSCPRPGCGKLFRYPSMLRTHEENVHEKLKYAEFVCVYPGCGDKFSDERALVTHAEAVHPYLLCEHCGETIPRRSFRRHIREHAQIEPSKVVCPYKGCKNTYTRESNLRKHVQSVHLKLKPFICSIPGCRQSFAHKASKDRHETSGRHLQPSIHFEEQDELRVTRPRGGRRPIFSADRVEELYKRRRQNDGHIWSSSL